MRRRQLRPPTGWGTCRRAAMRFFSIAPSVLPGIRRRAGIGGPGTSWSAVDIGLISLFARADSPKVCVCGAKPRYARCRGGRSNASVEHSFGLRQSLRRSVDNPSRAGTELNMLLLRSCGRCCLPLLGHGTETCSLPTAVACAWVPRPSVRLGPSGQWITWICRVKKIARHSQPCNVDWFQSSRSRLEHRRG